jgi:hydroxymethylglutaryl-CoA synthase
MSDMFISAVGGYLPLLRLDRKIAVSALRWSGLGGFRDGRRSVAGWDEDALTMSVEAARSLVGEVPDRLVLASTSAYFTERSQAALATAALALPEATRTIDAAGSRRAGTSAVLEALEGRGTTVVATGEKRFAQVGSAHHLLFGDGGAAVRVGDAGSARYLGGVSIAHDLIDIYTSRDQVTPYAYEERFVRDVAASEVIEPAVRAALGQAGVTPERVAHVAVAEPLPNAWQAVARKLGILAPNIATEVTVEAGDLGAAHPLFALAVAFARAAPGDIVLFAGFGSGCDAMLFEVTGEMPGAAESLAMLDRGARLTDYSRFLSLTGNLDLAWGMRSEFEQKAQASVLDRSGRDVHGFVGGRDSLGNVQFPKTAMPVNPALSSSEKLADVRLADEIGRVISATADRLNFTYDPPFDFGLVQFGNGARVMMEFTDRPEQGFAVGDEVAMRFRIKGQDRRRGFRTYFWKAAPIERPMLESL